jgi:hypothetical protein
MKCPQCKKEGCKYTDRKATGERKRVLAKTGKKVKEDTDIRQTNEAECNHCSWKGEL